MPAFSVPANLAFDDYDALKDYIADWMNRSDLTGAIPGMIALAEAAMRRKLHPVLEEMAVPVTTSAGLAAVPDGLISRVTYNFRTLARWSGYDTADVNSTNLGNEPFAYTVEAKNLRIWPPLDVALTVYYQPHLIALSDAAPTNDILSNFPDVYFFGAMLFAEGYVANDPRASLFKGLFDEALDGVHAYLSRQRYSGPLVPRIRREW